jgi:hypothetical protein
MERAVAYLRVSTQRQQRSGLGIEAQRATIARFAEAEGLTIIAEFVEVETGKGADALDRRPQLAAALAAAKSAKCSVLVSKLDRLSRAVAFVAPSEAPEPEFQGFEEGNLFSSICETGQSLRRNGQPRSRQGHTRHL